MTSFMSLLTSVVLVLAAHNDPCLMSSGCEGSERCIFFSEGQEDFSMDYVAQYPFDVPWMRVFYNRLGTCLNTYYSGSVCKSDIVCYPQTHYCDVSEKKCPLYPILEAVEREEGEYWNELINDGKDKPFCAAEICGVFEQIGLPTRNWRCLQEDGTGEYKGVDFHSGETGNCIEIQSFFGQEMNDDIFCHVNRQDALYTNVAIIHDNKCKLQVNPGDSCDDIYTEFDTEEWTADSYHCMNGTECVDSGDGTPFFCKFEKFEGEDCSDRSLTFCSESLECLSNDTMPEVGDTCKRPLDAGEMCIEASTETFCVDSYCDTTDGKCAVPDGDACTSDPECLNASECIDDICKPVIPHGEDCSAEGSVCQSGTECIDDICTVPHGGDCSDVEAVCQSGTECIEDICTVPHGEDCSAEGAVCRSGTECIDDICTVPHGGDCSDVEAVCPVELECQPNGDGLADTCKEEKDKGEECADSTKSFCGSGLQCHHADLTHHKCKEVLAEDEDCSDYALTFCGDSMVCFDDVCKSSANTMFAFSGFLSLFLFALF